MRKFVLMTAAAAALPFAAPGNADTTLISENFTSGLGVFTATGQVGINNGNGYVVCCGTTGSVANMSNNFVAFGSGDQPSGTLTSPTIDFVLNETYTLDFDFAELGSGTELLTIMLGPASSIIVSSAANNNLDTALTHVQLQFLVTPGHAGSGPVTISSSGGASVDSILDNFVLTTTAMIPGVPEPGTWAMMLLGFGAIGFAMRRRKVAALAA